MNSRETLESMYQAAWIAEIFEGVAERKLKRHEGGRVRLPSLELGKNGRVLSEGIWDDK